MMPIPQTLVSILPVVLLLLVLFVIRKTGQPETAGERSLLFLLIVGLLLDLVIMAAIFFEPMYRIPSMLSPLFLGVLALLALHARYWKQMPAGRRKLSAALGIAQLIPMLMVITRLESFLGYLIPSLLSLFLVWRLAGRGHLLTWLGVACLAMLYPYHERLISGASQNIPNWAAQALVILWLIYLPMIVILAGALLTTAIQPPAAGQPARWFGRIFQPVLAALLLGGLAYLIYWASVWDQTSDGLGGIFLFMLTTPAAIATGVVMAVKLRGEQRLAGLAFLFLVPVLLNLSFNLGWRVSYHELTDGRAENIRAALERFHTREGHYPTELGELVPRELLYLQGPVILRGEDWCYQGDTDSYRLGAIYREYFGLPISLRIYASAGEPFATEWACQSRLAEVQGRYQQIFADEGVYIGPTPVPLPTSVIPTLREPIQPLVKDASIIAGSWSLDGKIWLFSLRDSGAGPGARKLYFLDSEIGLICPADISLSSDFSLYEQHAWLADGRLLVIDSSETLYLLTPCEGVTEEITDRYPVRFQQVAKADARGEQVLLRTAETYDILDSKTMAARPIPGVTPNPYEAHWDHYTWTPSGAHLAISRLNGRDARQGSTLFWIDAESGAVQSSLDLREASAQSAPMVEWLSETELLLHGQEDLFIYDFAVEPPQVTSVMKDLFSLSLKNPEDTSSMAALVRPDGSGYHLLLRANHPRDKAIYWFDSQTRQVRVLAAQADALLFLPGGLWTMLPKFPGEVPEQDEYELYWLASGALEPQRLLVDGHLPREYPLLWVDYLPETSRLVFTSQQGISLVSLPDGKLLRFWELAGGSGIAQNTLPALDEQSLLVIAGNLGLYRIPLH